jgi:hypothetical protein
VSRIPHATELVFTFRRDRDCIGNGTTVVIEGGTTLTSWQDVYTVGTNTGNSTEEVE